MPPPEVLLPILAAAAVSGAVAFGAWPWRDRGWSLCLALGGGFATAYALAHGGVPRRWPTDVFDFLFFIAAVGAIWGAGVAEGRVKPRTRWIMRVALSAAAAGLLLQGKARWSAGEIALWTACAATALVAVWTLLDRRGRGLHGASQPVAFLLAAVGGALVFKFARNARLAQLEGAVAAAAGPLCVLALVHPKVPSFRLAPVATLLLGPLLVAGVAFGGDNLPWQSAVLLAVAPLAAVRRWWAGALVAALLAGAAVWFAYQGNLPDPDDPYAGYY